MTNAKLIAFASLVSRLGGLAAKPRSPVVLHPGLSLAALVVMGLMLVGVGAQAEDDAQADPARQDAAAVYVSDNTFAEVMDGLRLAIEERGLVINNIMHMNEMLERTGADLAMDGALFGEARSVEFCSAVLSRRMIAEDPSRIVNCPFIIAVYSLPDEPDKTLVAHRRFGADELANSEVMPEVAQMLQEIAEQAVSW
ncbi:DUF302 domain-containing protein [Thiorhodovibrio winogradskyi]|nr:DUF302 domain-containing protein [Thiorhodovibrio winogradskyi]